MSDGPYICDGCGADTNSKEHLCIRCLLKDPPEDSYFAVPAGYEALPGYEAGAYRRGRSVH